VGPTNGKKRIFTFKTSIIELEKKEREK